MVRVKERLVGGHAIVRQQRGAIRRREEGEWEDEKEKGKKLKSKSVFKRTKDRLTHVQRQLLALSRILAWLGGHET